MSHVVVISGHPDLEQSYTNTVILQQLEQGLENIEIRRLDQLYHESKIDVAAEQAALVKADVVVLQFPFYWYSVPGILKQWIDDVFAFNFAFGPEGDKLKGKQFILSFTVGGPEESYDPQGYNHFDIPLFMYPLQQTAYLAGMKYQKPVYTHGMVYIPGVYNKLEDVQQRAKDHAIRLIEQINQSLHSDEAYIRSFVEKWFHQFDLLPEDSSFFTARLSDQVNWVMPEGVFSGHEGFRDWYAIARSTFKPQPVHNVQQIEISKTDAGYQVDLRIQLIAETYPDSTLKGEKLELLVNETWQITLGDQGAITIHDYQVLPVTQD